MAPANPCSGCERCLPDAPCAGCPSPILDGAPRFSELINADDGSALLSVDEYHPGCWAAEQRRSEGAA